MATNVFSPLGLVLSRQRSNASPSYQGSKYKIKKGFASAIGRGDLVQTGTGANQGYIVPCGNNPTNILGVFNTVLGYFDLTTQAQQNGLNGSYATSANPQADIDCLVFDDPNDLFRAQVQGGPWAITWRGDNINFLSGTNGAPNSSTGLSTLGLDGTTVATTSSLPLRIQELVGVTGGPQDPANTNPWIEVSINFSISELQQATGI